MLNINNHKSPTFEIPGDREDRIMANSVEIIAATKVKALWRAGFLPLSDAAKAYGCSHKTFHWFLCDKNGKVIEKFVGFYMDLPEKLKKFSSKS